jgi:predicted phage terminase large subunit-like protein
MKIDEVYDQIIRDQKLRRELARRSLYYFFLIYLSHYAIYPTAAFQKEMFALTEDESIKNLVIVAFRSSAKSTIMALSYPLWAIVGRQAKRFVVIISQTQQLSRLILANIKRELEKNDLLISDFGAFEEEADEWRANSIVISKYQARITAISTGEGMRGLRHHEHRPDLIICDDIEDLASVNTREGRDKTYYWYKGEVTPAGDSKTRIIITGNMLHEDSLIMRLKESVLKGEMSGVYREYPLLDENGVPLWKEKFPTLKEIDDLKKTVADEATWQREYLLRIIPDKNRVIYPEWIHRYSEINERESDLMYIASGIDLAISQSESADYTAMVSARIYGYEENLRVYILPNPVNERLNFPDTLERAKSLSSALGHRIPTKLFIEDVGYQRSLIEELAHKGYPAEGVKIAGQDKHARLSLTTHLIQLGNILFPEKGAEELISQLVNFGYERHDDLVDAFVILILKVKEEDGPKPIVKAYIL